MRAYHRVDPLMDERKGHYTPAQLGAFLKVQLVAGRQSQRGRFRSLQALKAMLPSAYSRHVDFMVEQRDLDVLADGTVYVDGWDEWQEGDLTVKDRMARLRNRQRNAAVTPPVTEPSPTAIGVGVGIDDGVDDNGDAHASPTARAWDDEPDIDAYVFAIRLLTYAPNSDRFRDEMTALEEQFGREPTVQAEQDAYRNALNEGRTLSPFDLLKDTRTILRTTHHLETRELTTAEKAQAAERRKREDARRVADIKRQHDEEFERTYGKASGQ